MEHRPMQRRTSEPGATERRHAAAMQARPAAALNAARIAIRELDFFYGDQQGAEGHQPRPAGRQVTGMIGPSGCGKSTLLRVLNRMYDLYPGQRATGEVMMDGDEHHRLRSIDLNQLRSRVGMVFQKPTPFPMSIYDNIAFGVKLHERLSQGGHG